MLLQIVAAYAYRAWSVPVYKMRPFSNKALLAVIILVLALQAPIIYLPMLRPIFGTVALPLSSYLEPLCAGAIVLILMEGMKQWSKRDKNE